MTNFFMQVDVVVLACVIGYMMAYTAVEFFAGARLALWLNRTVKSYGWLIVVYLVYTLVVFFLWGAYFWFLPETAIVTAAYGVLHYALVYWAKYSTGRATGWLDDYFA